MRYWKPKPLTGSPKVGIAVAAFAEEPRRKASLRCLLASLQAQTHANWTAEVVHDGPAPDGWEAETAAGDDRIHAVATDKRLLQFGHPHRQRAITALLARGCEWIGLTNDDNYYAPVYFEWLVSTAQQHRAQFAYCDMIRSHKMWKPTSTDIRRGHIDLGGFLAHRAVVERIKFDNFSFIGDWDYVKRLTGAARHTIKVPATLFVHN